MTVKIIPMPKRTSEKQNHKALYIKIVYGLALLASLLWLAACGDDKALTDSAAVRERAQAFWQARVDNDPFTAYDYELISLEAEASLRDYVRRSPGLDYRNVTVVEVEIIEPGQARVTLDIEYRLLGQAGVTGLGTLNRRVDEQWLWRENNWYRSTDTALQQMFRRSTP